ncbi:MAG: hypothetical protein IJ644_05265, partial [Oscillospiraceae bacterium]|nr:hypothetical protein [Oscillospiraceae bacterium]
GKTVTTKYLSNKTIKGFDTETSKELDYLDVQIECKVIEESTSTKTVRNIAEITIDSNNDIDSTPHNVDNRDGKYNPPANNSEYQEDDDDYEDLVMEYFDLSLQKFITAVNDRVTDAREPEVSLSEDNKLEYTTIKDPILVVNNDTVIYTIRVYNEGTKAGYAEVRASESAGIGRDSNKIFLMLYAEMKIFARIRPLFQDDEKQHFRKPDFLLKNCLQFVLFVL